MKSLVRYIIGGFLYAADRPVFGEKLITQRQAAHSVLAHYELQLLIDQEKRKENAGTG